MVHRGQVIEDDTLRLEFTATSADTDGALHEMRARYAPHGGFPPAHLHPHQEERFLIERGRLLFEVDGHLRSVAVGEQIVVPRGAVHRVRNAGDEPAVALWQTRPALRTGEFLTCAVAARDGGGVLRLAAVVDEHRDVYRIAVRPRWLTTRSVRALAAIDRLVGRAGGSRRRQPA
jgi:mannose-6-phosphate isomerase-like protein (cupin superfamily)